MAHAKLSPSGASRWLNCPGSIRLCSKVPRKPASKYASEGSAAHYVGEKCLRDGDNAASWIGREVTVREGKRLVKFTVDAGMAEAVQVYLDYVRGTMARLDGAKTQIEGKVNYGHWVPKGFGTGDFIAVQPIGTLAIVDYKHGAGVAVDIKGNTQLRIYALGALGRDNPNMVETVEMTIVQPRAQHPDGPVRTDVMTAEELLAWADEVLAPGAAATAEPDAPLATGSWCRWCDALDTCPQARGEASQTMFGTTNLPTVDVAPALPDVETMTPEKMAQVYAVSTSLIEPWLKAVKAAWQEHLSRTGPDQGYKLVAGRSTRKWANPIQAELELGDVLGGEAYEEPKLKSPAQIEKTLKKAGQDPTSAAHLVETTRGVSVAKVTDKRPALPAAPEQMFGESES